MELPDCPPGAEGYEDTVVEMPKKVSQEDGDCTKAEQEFQDHLNSLKIKVDNVGARCMVERRGRDVSGKWIYLCYPCAAVCSGESILQTHISGKKHKTKLSMRNVWPQSIFDEHPYVLTEKGISKDKPKDGATEKVLQKMAEEVTLHNNSGSELDRKYNGYRNVRCHLQDALDGIKAPLVGLEYLVEHPPEQAHYEPSYMCTLCHKQGHPRTIINHMTCFWHRYNYLTRHYTKAIVLLAPYRSAPKYREGVNLIINRLTQRVEDKYGRLKPVNIDKEEYEKDRDTIHQWICKSHHFSEKDGPSFEEVVDIGLLESLHKSNEGRFRDNKRDPSPPVVAAPSKPLFNNYTRPAGRQERRVSTDALSDISDEPEPRRRDAYVARQHGASNRFEPYRGRQESPPRQHRYTNKSKNTLDKDSKLKPPNYEYKVKLASEQRRAAEEALKKTLVYHEKNPEKHPLYPEEWKKFWNRRYKEIQTEGKDPSKHDFKPEWILYWTARMKELHEQELRVQVGEIYRKMCLPVPEPVDEKQPTDRKSPDRRRSPDARRRSPDFRRRSPIPRRRSPGPGRRSPGHGRRSPGPGRRSPGPGRRSPGPGRRSPGPSKRSPGPGRRSPGPGRRSPGPGRRSPGPGRRSPGPGRPDIRQRSPIPRRRTPDRRRTPSGSDRFKWRKDEDRNRRDYRSPGHHGFDSRPEAFRGSRPRSRSPVHSRTRSPPRTNFEIESVRRSRSPLSRRDDPAPLRNRSPRADLAPSLQTVLVSDDELRPDDGLSPWNSDNDSLGSLPDARSPARNSCAGSEMSRASRSRRDAPRARPAEPADLGPPENIVATLRLLVALEDYLGSLGPKIVDLLTEALKLEKDKANSSEELLERESAVVLIETAKEKLKGAALAGLVAAAAAPAVRAAVVRAAATLHEADQRANKQKPSQKAEAAVSSSLPVAGVGSVDRASIAAQMAAALVAQGKTDVSSEELAQLVDAVVGMAEAKKREAEVKKKVEARAAERASRPHPPPATQGKTASALQMLQSAYDENEKRIEKEDAPDAMDGLSDSDLETLLKNFNELSAEEQHSLIAYLKKLEAREPQRVEKLRQYVSAADESVAPAPAAAPPVAAAAAPAAPAAPVRDALAGTVTIDSDDDDYAVEEVFQSATQKVKEDQIRQEMEIVKKSLEESTKSATPTPEPQKAEPTKHTSSATDLFALVQASLQSTKPALAAKPVDVVAAHAQPRSFGDAPDRGLLGAFLDRPGDNTWTQPSPPEDSPMPDPPDQDQAGPFAQDGGGTYQNNQDNQSSFDQDNREPFDQDNSGPYNHDNRALSNQDNRAPFNQDSRGHFIQDVRGQFNQDTRGPFNQDRGGSFNQQGSFNQGGGSFNQPAPFNQGGGGGSFNQGGAFDQEGSFNQGGGTFNQDNRGPFIQGNKVPLIPDTPAPFNNSFNLGPMFQNNLGMQNNRGFPMQNNRAPPLQDNRGGFMQNNRPGPGFNNFGQDNTNQFNRGNNFTNGNNAWQDQQQQQQYGNFDQQKNFRGRGRGNFGGGGHMRGRGRGNRGNY